MKRIVNAHLTIPIEIDEKGSIKLLNEYTQTTVSEFDGTFKPRDNMYQKIMDFLKQEKKQIQDQSTAATQEQDPLMQEPTDAVPIILLNTSSLKKPRQNQTFKTYGTHKSIYNFTRKLNPLL